MTITKIGYSLGPLLSMHEVIACAKLADSQQNVDSIWVPESWGRESFATLGAMSQITRRVRLGTSIISIYSRTPATVAMAATTLDMLSNKRTIIGLGPSTAAIVENWHGLKFERPASRMREYVECLKLMASGEKVNYNGEFFKANNFKILHQPLRKHIPIFMAAVNKKMVSLASEIADGVLLYLRPLDELKRQLRSLNEVQKRGVSRLPRHLSARCQTKSLKKPGSARQKRLHSMFQSGNTIVSSCQKMGSGMKLKASLPNTARAERMLLQSLFRTGCLTLL